MNNDTFLYGDIIRVKKHCLYWHYGIFIGKGKVIHFSSFPYRFWQGFAKVKLINIDDFKKYGAEPSVAYRPKTEQEASRTVANASYKLGKGLYIPIINDCKRFAFNCIEHG